MTLEEISAAQPSINGTADRPVERTGTLNGRQVSKKMSHGRALFYSLLLGAIVTLGLVLVSHFAAGLGWGNSLAINSIPGLMTFWITYFLIPKKDED